MISRFEKDCAYFIDVVNHGKGHPDVWGDVSRLEILYRNWPGIFGEWMFLREGVEETIPRSASDYIKLRNSGINTPIVIDGKAFIAPGLGIAMDGSQSQAVQISLRINRELDLAEANFRKVEPSAKALLALKDDYSVGFFVPKTNTYYCSYKYSENIQITQLFFRLLSEIPLPTNKTHNGFFLPK